MGRKKSTSEEKAARLALSVFALTAEKRLRNVISNIVSGGAKLNSGERILLSGSLEDTRSLCLDALKRGGLSQLSQMEKVLKRERKGSWRQGGRLVA